MKKIICIPLTIILPLFITSCGSSSSTSTSQTDNNLPTNERTESNESSLVTNNPILPTENNNSVPTIAIPINESNESSPTIENPILPSEENLSTIITENNTTVPTEEIPTLENRESNLSTKFTLPDSIKESSGLIKLDNQLWTHNDSGDEAKLYQVDESTGAILKTLTLSNATNNDWEDISYDENYVYIGDFGNNNGNRRDLKIYKIPRADLKTETTTVAEIINFSYSDQTDFTSNNNKHNFDMEAMVAYKGKLYLFSKNWENLQTRLYELETTEGTLVANYKSSFETEGLVTGATVNSELDILLLTTYSTTLNVNIWSFSNYNNADFFNGTAKQLNPTTPIQAQVEGITFVSNNRAYLSSEAFSNTNYGITFNSTLYELDFSKEF